KLSRGQEAGVNDGFSGFSPQFTQLMLASVVMTLLLYGWMVPAVIAFFAVGAHQAAQRGNFPGIPIIILGIVAMPLIIYLATVWIFTLPLMVDKKYGFWDAMNVSRRVVNRQWLNIFLLLLVLGLLQIA